MLESMWSRLRMRGNTLPMRDIFDADLDRARRKSGCALCRLVQEHDQHTMRSFLWEYCTNSHIGIKISKSWGFCPSHTWSLAVLEHERMGDGLGITIVYQALLSNYVAPFHLGISQEGRVPLQFFPVGRRLVLPVADFVKRPNVRKLSFSPDW